MHSAHLAATRAGPITLWVSPRGVRRIEFGPLPRGRAGDPPEDWPELLTNAVTQIEEYLAKDRREFDLTLDFPESTSPFQRDVYDRLLRIPYGHVASYARVAQDIGKSLGDDLAEGKPTLPLIRAMQAGGAEQRAVVRRAILDGGREDFAQVLAVIEATDALAYARAAAARESQAAVRAIAALPASAYRDSLLELAAFAVDRTY